MPADVRAAGEIAAVAPVQTVSFAAGCFRHVEEVFRPVPGVLTMQAGHTGAATQNPSYGQVGRHHTGHVEAVQLTCDSSQSSCDDLPDAF